MSDLAALLRDAQDDFSSIENIQEAYIPESLNPVLRKMASDVVFREECAQELDNWRVLTHCVDRAQIYGTGEDSYKRYLNGLLLISRSLACVDGSSNLGRDFVATTTKYYTTLLSAGITSTWDEKLVLTILQVLSNFATEAFSSKTGVNVLDSLTTRLDTETRAQQEFCRLLANSTYAHPILVLLSQSHTDFSNPSCKAIFLQILGHTELWFSSESELDKHICISLNQLIVKAVKNCTYPSILDQFNDAEVNEDQYLSLLKLLDVAIAERSKRSLSQDASSNLMKSYCRALQSAISKSMPFITNADTSPEYSQVIEVQIANIWNCLILILDSIYAILECASPTEPLIGTIVERDSDIVQQLVELLGAAQLHLPAHSKLSNLQQAVKHNDRDLDPQEFPLIKGKIIAILSLLARGNTQVQDEIRERHGLEVVLSNCIIDTNNPYIRERAILCIRYLLENNKENQRIVAQLEAKKAVSEDALEEAGFETEVINGQLALKKRQ